MMAIQLMAESRNRLETIFRWLATLPDLINNQIVSAMQYSYIQIQLVLRFHIVSGFKSVLNF